MLELLAAGGINRDISLELGISAKIVMHHTSSIYRKLGVRGRAEAVAHHLGHVEEGRLADQHEAGRHRWLSIVHEAARTAQR